MDPRFFGYGSLVNRATHAYPNGRPALLTGWRRVWVQTQARPLAFLSVEQTPGVTIAGLVADVPGGDWVALDAREFAYARNPVTVQAGPDRLAAQVYAVPAGQTGDLPILLSYLDAVVQGFLHEYGPEGAAGFFDTTVGWGAPVLDDRAAPLYPRAQTLAPDECAVVDAGLDALGCRRISAVPAGLQAGPAP